jgi:hypothetical protein
MSKRDAAIYRKAAEILLTDDWYPWSCFMAAIAESEK